MDVDLKGCTDGDRMAWEGFVRRCSGVIHAAVRRTLGGRGRTPSGTDVDDCVQDVFVRLVRHDFRLLRSYDPDRSALSTWLTLIARSVAIDHLRRRALATVPIRSEDAPAVGGGPAADPEPAAAPGVPLHLLTDRQRLVLRMLFEQEMTVPETAAMLGVGEQTIRSTKHKALVRLRSHFDPDPAVSCVEPGG